MTIDLLALAHLGAPLSYGGLALVPLFARREPRSFHDGAAAAAAGILVLEEQAQASVPGLLATNLSNKPVLIAEGCLLLGGLQDRISLRPTWVEAGAKAKVPVHCVEQSRWKLRGTGPEAQRFRVDRASAAFRSARMAQAPEQGRTWALVAERRARAGRHDGSGSLGELRSDHTIEHLAQQLELPWSACGVVGCWQHEGETRWPLVEWFSDPSAFRLAWPSIRRGLAEAHLDRLHARGVHPRDARTPRIRLSDIHARLRRLSQLTEAQRVEIGPRATGLQLRHRGSQRTVDGWVSLVQHQPVHLGLVRGAVGVAA